MPKFVTALFENADEADQAIEALKGAKFRGPDIQIVEQEREAAGFFDRLFMDENGRGDAQNLRVMGIPREKVDRYAGAVRRGAVLVIVMSEEEREQEAQQILERFDTAEVGATRTGVSGASSPPGPQDRMPETSRGKPVAEGEPPKWFRVVDVEESDPREGAKSHSVHIQPASDVDHVDSGELPGAQRAETFDRFEDEFRVHYEENFAESDYGFDDFRLAYLYGMSLAQNKELADRDWSQIKEHAGRGWSEHSTKPWSLFQEAVRFGWRIIRREQRRGHRQERRP